MTAHRDRALLIGALPLHLQVVSGSPIDDTGRERLEAAVLCMSEDSARAATRPNISIATITHVCKERSDSARYPVVKHG